MKKISYKILDIFSNVMMVIAVCMMVFTFVSVNTFNRQDRNLLGYKAFIVLSDSMKATDFDAGDLVITKNVDPATLKKGDIIAYVSNDTSNYGEVVTHKIRTVNFDNTFTTYGTTTDTDDQLPVDYSQVIGKYIFAIPAVGTFFNFLKTTPGYICCIFVPFLVLIILQGLQTIKLFKQYKKEQKRELEKEKKALQEEREQSRLMMNEILAMKHQMELERQELEKSKAQLSNKEEDSIFKSTSKD